MRAPTRLGWASAPTTASRPSSRSESRSWPGAPTAGSRTQSAWCGALGPLSILLLEDPRLLLGSMVVSDRLCQHSRHARRDPDWVAATVKVRLLYGGTRPGGRRSSSHSDKESLRGWLTAYRLLPSPPRTPDSARRCRVFSSAASPPSRDPLSHDRDRSSSRPCPWARPARRGRTCP